MRLCTYEKKTGCARTSPPFQDSGTGRILGRASQQNQPRHRLKFGDQEKIKQRPQESEVLFSGRPESR